MMNMAHCRFHNTLAALRECEEAWEESLSHAEEKERARLLVLCEKIVAEYGDVDFARG